MTDDVTDLCQLPKIDMPHMLSALQARFTLRTVYTRIGGRSILLSVNPYSRGNVVAYGTKLYSPEQCSSYLQAAKQAQQSQLPPHVYEIAADGFTRSLGLVASRPRKDQTIIITGDSGAGKTENAKHIFQFLSAASSDGSDAASGDGSGDELKRKFDQSNFILEVSILGIPTRASCRRASTPPIMKAHRGRTFESRPGRALAARRPLSTTTPRASQSSSPCTSTAAA